MKRTILTPWTYNYRVNNTSAQETFIVPRPLFLERIIVAGNLYTASASTSLGNVSVRRTNATSLANPQVDMLASLQVEINNFAGPFATQGFNQNFEIGGLKLQQTQPLVLNWGTSSGVLVASILMVFSE